MKDLSIVSKVGLIAGFLFFVHALIPFSHAWPLIWPSFAGIFLIILLKNKGKLQDFSNTLKSLFKTSVLSGIIFFVFTIAVLYIIGFPAMNRVSKLLGADGPIIINSSLVFGLLLAAGLGIITAMISGSILYPFIRNR